MSRPIALALTFLAGLTSLADHPAPDNPLPNILVMLADDMGMGDSSAYQDVTGNSDKQQINTPAMAKLARMGVRFTDAHAPSSRCSPTRYSLLTGRYAWRSRLKWWVLFGAQGDPLIEPGRPTLATRLREAGYHTGMVGKWHVGLRYRQTDGRPAAAWKDADLRQPLYDCPLDHGFDYAAYTSRSHATSGPDDRYQNKKRSKRNKPDQTVGPGHLIGRYAAAASQRGRQLIEEGLHPFRLTELGGYHSDNALRFLQNHTGQKETLKRPFFLYYASNANHGPYTPDDAIGGVSIKGQGANMQGEPMGLRYDYIFENDVALNRIINFLETTDDPRRPGHKLVSNTLMLFTSDNGAEIVAKSATGPFRSNKGSTYEGGHRVPFILSWPQGHIGDGDPNTPGKTNRRLVGLQDLYATAEAIITKGRKASRKDPVGGEDSYSLFDSLAERGIANRAMFFNDHKESKDAAVCAFRINNPSVKGAVWPGQWKLFFDAGLLRHGEPNPIELYRLDKDPREQVNLIQQASLQTLVQELMQQALSIRTAGSHHRSHLGANNRVLFGPQGKRFDAKTNQAFVATWRIKKERSVAHLTIPERPLLGTIQAFSPTQTPVPLLSNQDGLAIETNDSSFIDGGEQLAITFNKDVLVEYVSLESKGGSCGGTYQVGAGPEIQLYCLDEDIDDRDQSGITSDLGYLGAGETLALKSAPYLGVESPGAWRLKNLSVRVLP